MTLVPTETFDPSVEEVVAFASSLARARRAVPGLVPRWAGAVRIVLASDEDGRLTFGIEGPPWACGVLRAAGYGEVVVRPAPDGERRRAAYTRRAELVLAHRDARPLREGVLVPDPLTPLARACGQLHAGESVTVAIDLAPVPPGRSRRARASVGTVGGWRALDPSVTLAGGSRRPPRADARPSKLAAATERAEVRGAAGKLTRAEPAFIPQVLVEASSADRGRAMGHVRAVLAVFEQFSGENHWRAAGVNLGFMFMDGGDSPWRRRAFDRRLRVGIWRPRRRVMVTTSEVVGLLKPPTRRCASPQVLRCGGVIPPPPPHLPTWRGQADLLPLGTVETEDGPRPVGVRVAETHFTLHVGRSRGGKTETALVRLVALARAGHGVLMLDPHHDAIERAKPYLTDLGQRVLEIDLSPRGAGARTAGWNLFSMEGRSDGDVEARVAAVVDSFASALAWGDTGAPRALTLVTMGAQALCELALRLPPELAPTIFQLTTLLSDDGWRARVLPHLSPTAAAFFRTRFPRLEKDPAAITPVTNLIDRLRSSSSVAALLGSSRSSYDVRVAMDRGDVVLACPAGSGDKDRLVAAFVIFDLLQAALSRRDTPPEHRRPFHVFVDELQVVDGASRGNLAALLQQAGKFGLRLHAMTQDAGTLTAATRDALLTNRSHLFASTSGADAATMLAREWGGRVTPATITALERYTYLAGVTLGGEAAAPFLVRGLTLEQAFGAAARPDDVAALDVRIDTDLARRSQAEVLADLERLDERIVAQLAGPPRPRRRGLQVVGD